MHDMVSQMMLVQSQSQTMKVQECESNVSIILIGAIIDWCESTDTQGGQIVN